MIAEILLDWIIAVGLCAIALFTGMTASMRHEPLLWGASIASAIAAIAALIGILVLP